MRYFDTSVVAAFYLPEPMSAKVQKLFSRGGGIAISGLTEVEFVSALSRRVRTRDIAKDDSLKVLARFRRHVEDGLYRMIAVEQRDYVLARDWLATFDTSLRTLDALHMAVAFSNDLAVVTADKAFGESAQRLGVKHKLIA